LSVSKYSVLTSHKSRDAGPRAACRAQAAAELARHDTVA
jgi:hypothetical protein